MKKILLAIFFITFLLFYQGTLSFNHNLEFNGNFNANSELTNNNSTDFHLIPFDNFSLTYNLKIKYADFNIPSITLNVYYKNITYLSLPISFGLQFKRLSINAGTEVSAALTAKGRQIHRTNYYGADTTFRNTDKLEIDRIMIGPEIDIQFKLTNKLSLEGTYYYGITNLLSSPSKSDWKWKAQQAVIGIRYTLRTTQND